MITKTQSDNIENQEILRRHPEVYSTAAIPLSKSFSYWSLEYFLPLTQSLLLLLLLYGVSIKRKDISESSSWAEEKQNTLWNQQLFILLFILLIQGNTWIVSSEI